VLYRPIFYLIGCSVAEPPPAGASTLVESTTDDVVSTSTAAESVVSVVVDPEPQDTIANVAIAIKNKMYFFISVNIQKYSENKKPQQGCRGLRSFGGFNPTYL